MNFEVGLFLALSLLLVSVFTPTQILGGLYAFGSCADDPDFPAGPADLAVHSFFLFIVLAGALVYLFETFPRRPATMPSKDPTLREHAEAAEANGMTSTLMTFAFLAIGGWLIAYGLGMTGTNDGPTVVTTSGVPVGRSTETGISKTVGAMMAFALFIAAWFIGSMRGDYKKDLAAKREAKARRKAEKRAVGCVALISKVAPSLISRTADARHRSPVLTTLYDDERRDRELRSSRRDVTMQARATAWAPHLLAASILPLISAIVGPPARARPVTSLNLMRWPSSKRFPKHFIPPCNVIQLLRCGSERIPVLR
jgi:hypothetical protein